MIGKKFGKLTVLEEIKERSSNGSILYLCICDCGNEKIVSGAHLRSGHTKSCGCENHKITNYANSQFGSVLVLDNYIVKGNKTKWNCKCGYCGKEFYTSISSLKSGRTKSCGCQSDITRRESIKERMGFICGTSLVSLKEDRKLNKNNSTGHRGVTFNKKKGKYVAQIMFKRKTYFLGYFDSINDAIRVRKEAERKYFNSLKINRK